MEKRNRTQGAAGKGVEASRGRFAFDGGVLRACSSADANGPLERGPSPRVARDACSDKWWSSLEKERSGSSQPQASAGQALRSDPMSAASFAMAKASWPAATAASREVGDSGTALRPPRRTASCSAALGELQPVFRKAYRRLEACWPCCCVWKEIPACRVDARDPAKQLPPTPGESRCPAGGGVQGQARRDEGLDRSGSHLL